MNILCIDCDSNTYDMPIPRYIATLALMPKSALNKSWRYIEGGTVTAVFYTCNEYADYSSRRLRTQANIRYRSVFLYLRSIMNYSTLYPENKLATG